MDELWLPVVGFEGFYEVSSFGNVRSIERTGWHDGRWGRVLMRFPARSMRIGISTNGYRYLKLTRPGEKPTHCLVHRLVMAAHIGPPPMDRPQVNHVDGDKANNMVGNLEYCSCLDNLTHCIDVLGKKRGEGSASPLTDCQVRSIRRDARILRAIAADHGISIQAVWAIKKRKTWGHLHD